MKINNYYLLAVVIFLQGCQSFAEKMFLPTDDVRVAEYSTTVEKHAPVPMRDGVRLYADVYHPIASIKTPTILVRIPFANTFSNRLKSGVIARYWARRGYHVVVQGTRGRFQSEGVFYPLRNERQDGIDTLQWLDQQDWFDGRLGMWGGSAFGYTQWVLYDQQLPGPGALNIQIASTSFYDMFYPGGGFSMESALFWAIRSYKGNGDIATQQELSKGADGFPLIDADERAIADIPYFNDWVKHTKRDDYWKSIDDVNRANDVKAPVLLMAGWFDPFLPSQLKDFQSVQNSKDPEVKNKSRLIIGPWAHAESVKFPGDVEVDDYRKAVLAPSVAWFDKILKFKSDNTVKAAPVRLYVMGEHSWRDEQEWPLKRTQYTPFFLASSGKAGASFTDGKLVTSPSRDEQQNDTFVYDPNDPVPSTGGAMLGINAGIRKQNALETRDDVLVFSSEPLTQPVEVTGPVKVVLYVKTTAINTDFTAKLVDVHPDGLAFNVSDGLLRQQYHRTDVTEPKKIEIDLWPTSMLFKRGHQIRIQISSSNYPRYDRNPNTGSYIPLEHQAVEATQTIFHNEKYPSRIVLPIIPRESG